MTNKLRSVIEDQETFVRTVSYQITVEEDNAVSLRFARKALHRLTTGILDAIIEELEEDYRTDSGKGGTVMCLSPVLYAQIQKLKQAREELSTSLTQ